MGTADHWRAQSLLLLLTITGHAALPQGAATSTRSLPCLQGGGRRWLLLFFLTFGTINGEKKEHQSLLLVSPILFGLGPEEEGECGGGGDGRSPRKGPTEPALRAPQSQYEAPRMHTLMPKHGVDAYGLFGSHSMNATSASEHLAHPCLSVS